NRYVPSLKLKCFISVSNIFSLVFNLCVSIVNIVEQKTNEIVLYYVILPCLLEPAADVVSKSLEWGRLDLEPRFVHVWHEGQNLLVNQNPAYRGRTSLSTEKLKHGDLSLSLSALKRSDNGQYRCYFPSQGKTSTVELLVGKWTCFHVCRMFLHMFTLVLKCESKGWYPEPELLWLDAEGKILSAGPTETVRGPDDLYTVSSRVTLVNMLKEQSDELNKVKTQLEHQNKDMEREHVDFDKKLQSVDKETESDKVKGYLKLKEITLEIKRQLTKRKQEHEALQQNTQTVLNKTDKVMKEMENKKKEVEKHKVEISKELKKKEKNQLEQKEET
uniref:Butyrophilin subfamily 3 member A2-like Ig-C domain-containing protein n=1 Tax=Anabas testudineus TaxID=64144 RepID=A0A3Q1II50_ANATE